MKLATQTKIFLALCAGPLLAASVASASSTYEDDLAVATQLSESCDWNTVMCCWSGNEGTMTDNTDVCRVLDYPAEGEVLEMPREDEGSAYCHGFAWSNGAAVSTHILPLYQYVTNLGSTAGFTGTIEGSPQCGCIDEMPVVSDAACSSFTKQGIKDCNGNSLRKWYKRVKKPNGNMDSNLVKTCNNEQVPDFDFHTCSHNTYMCCWNQREGAAVADNTDVCRVMDYPAIGQTTELPGDDEGAVHCHGFVWPEDATDTYIDTLAQYVQNFDHANDRGYYGNIEGAPMCGCVEDMPEVSRADCTRYKTTVEEGKFRQCKRNDLRRAYNDEYPSGDLANLVGACDNAGA